MKCLTVGELLNTLRNIDRNAYVLVNGDSVYGVSDVKSGRMQFNYMGDAHFKPHTKPRSGADLAVNFTRWGEQSDGVQRLVDV